MGQQTWREKLKESAARHEAQRAWDRAHPEEARARKAAQLAEARAAHEAQQLEEMDAFLARCGVGDEELDVLRAGVRPDWGSIIGANGQRFSAVTEARAFWASGETFLALLGTTGTGKSVAAAELCSLCRFGYVHPDLGPTWCWSNVLSEQPLFTQAPQLARRSAFGTEIEKENSALRRVRLLVIDELGAEIMTDAWSSVIQELVQARYRAKLKTVLLANLGPEKFFARYDRRVRRRVEEAGRVVNLGSAQLSGKGGAR